MARAMFLGDTSSDELPDRRSADEEFGQAFEPRKAAARRLAIRRWPEWLL